MNHYNSLSHTRWEWEWECKYHIIFIPKYRRKGLFSAIKKHLGVLFHDLSRQKECVIEEGHIMPGHVHMLISIPPKHSVSGVVSFIKGKGAIQIARQFMNREKNFMGYHFWASGYFFTTVGHNEEAVKKHIKEQDQRDRVTDQLSLNLPL